MDKCRNCIVLWPDVEACDFQCELPEGHEGLHHDPECPLWWNDDQESWWENPVGAPVEAS